MSIIVMKRKFEAPPSKDDIMGLVVGEVGDKSHAKQALLNFLAPMKDLLALLAYTETLDASAEQYAAMLKEQGAVAKDIESLKGQTTSAKSAANDAAKKLKDLGAQIADLEAKRDAVAAEVVSEQEAKLRVSKAVADEYDKLRKEMLAQVKVEEKAARKSLEAIQANIASSQAELDTLAEKKRAFIASLGG